MSPDAIFPWIQSGASRAEKNILKKSGASRPAHLLIKSTFSPPHWKIPSLFAPHFLLDFIFVFLYQVPHKSLRVCCTCTLTGTLKFNSNALFFCYSLIPYTATGYPLFLCSYTFSKHEIWQWGNKEASNNVWCAGIWVLDNEYSYGYRYGYGYGYGYILDMGTTTMRLVKLIEWCVVQTISAPLGLPISYTCFHAHHAMMRMMLVHYTIIQWF